MRRWIQPDECATLVQILGSAAVDCRTCAGAGLVLHSAEVEATLLKRSGTLVFRQLATKDTSESLSFACPQYLADLETGYLAQGTLHATRSDRDHHGGIRKVEVLFCVVMSWTCMISNDMRA